jgi:hypothetical protein
MPSVAGSPPDLQALLRELEAHKRRWEQLERLLLTLQQSATAEEWAVLQDVRNLTRLLKFGE